MIDKEIYKEKVLGIKRSLLKTLIELNQNETALWNFVHGNNHALPEMLEGMSKILTSEIRKYDEILMIEKFFEKEELKIIINELNQLDEVFKEQRSKIFKIIKKYNDMMHVDKEQTGKDRIKELQIVLDGIKGEGDEYSRTSTVLDILIKKLTEDLK